MASSAPSYAPLVSSPLNPSNRRDDGSAARIARRRRSRSGKRGSGSHTLTQRLLRSKAAEAWRGHVISSQLEGAGVVVPRKMVKSRVSCTPLPGLKSLGLSFSLVGYSEGRQCAVSFRLPDLSSVTTRRVLLAMGLVGVIPALGVKNFLRPAEQL